MTRLLRRGFLRGAGGVIVGLPFLEAFERAASAGGTPAPAQRLVTILHPQGTLLEDWTPASTGMGFALPPVLTALEPVADKVNVLSGLENGITNEVGAGHGTSGMTMLTARPTSGSEQPDGSLEFVHPNNTTSTGPSIDQEIATRMAGSTPFPSVDLAIGGGTQSGTLFAGAGDNLSLEPSPAAAFDRLFSDFTDAEAPSTMQRIRDQRASVLDGVLESFDALNQRVGAQDRQRLEAHADKIRQLEAQVGFGSLDCSAPALPEHGGDYDPSNSDFDNLTAPQMVDILVMALACGLSHVGSLSFTASHTPDFPWLDVDMSGWGYWHEMVHGARDTPSGRAMMLTVFQWYTEVVADLLVKMDAVDEGDGTLLDNSFVLWGSEFGDGASHRSSNLPIVQAGSAGGQIQTGRHVDYTGYFVGDLCTSMLEAFGHSGELFGWTGATTGPLPGLLT